MVYVNVETEIFIYRTGEGVTVVLLIERSHRTDTATNI